MATKPAAAKPLAKRPARRAAASKARAPKKPAPKGKAEPPRIEAADLLPGDATTDSPPSGAYLRVKVRDVSIGYVSDRRAGKLVEVLTSRLKGVRPALLAGTTIRQNQTALLVTDKATAAQARKLFAHAARTVAGAGA